MEEDSGRPTPKLASLLLLLFISSQAAAVTPGIIHVSSEKGGDYCFLFPSQWMSLSNKDKKVQRLDLEVSTQSLTYAATCCLPSFFGQADSDGGGFSTRIASVREGHCNLYENAKLRQINRTQGLLTLGGDAPSLATDRRAAYNWGHCEEVTLPGTLLSDEEILNLLFTKLLKDLLYKSGAIYLLATAMVTIGSYWAGSAERGEKQDAEDSFAEITIDFTSTCTRMAPFVLLAVYCFHDYLTYGLTGVFCLCASCSLYSCLTPSVSHIPFGKHAIRVPYFHKCLEIRRLLLAALCLSVSATWVIFRKDSKWGWVLQDALGVSIGIYMLRTVHIPNLQMCGSFLFVHLFSDVLSAVPATFLTKTGEGPDMAAFASSNSEELPFLLKVPIIPSSDLDGTSFTAVSLGDIVLPGLLVAYCHRFDVQVESSGIYFLASTLAYSYGLLAMFIVATFTQASQPTLPYLVPCILIASLAVAASRKEVIFFWTGVGSANDTPQPSSLRVISYTDMPQDSETLLICQQGRGKQINVELDEEDLNSSAIYRNKSSELQIHSKEVTN